MSVKQFPKISLAYLVISMFLINAFAQQIEEAKSKVQLTHKNLSGPRIGVTFIPGDNELYDKIREQNMGRLISQFGWHFEWRITPAVIAGPSFLVEFIPLISGVEYSKFVPSASLVFGIRLVSDYEFGLGPNLGTSGSSLVIAAGKNFNFGGVNIPINFAYVVNPKGDRLTFLVGYAIE